MNEHLNEVFSIIIPEFEKNGISHWVFGGVAVAAIKGDFLRENGDVDTFVEERDFEKAKSVLEKLCLKYSDWKICCGITNNIRPKIEIKINEKEVFSLIPVYKNSENVQFIFPNGGDICFSSDILNSVDRKIADFTFVTSADKYIKRLFENHYNLLLKRKNKGIHIDKNKMNNYEKDKKYLESLNIS